MSTPLLDITLPMMPPSLNEWYSGSHWSSRKRTKDAWATVVKAAVRDAAPLDAGAYPIVVDVTVAFPPGARRYDADNCVPAAKLVTDALEAADIIEADSCRYVAEVRLRHDRDAEGDGYTRYRLLES